MFKHSPLHTTVTELESSAPTLEIAEFHKLKYLLDRRGDTLSTSADYVRAFGQLNRETLIDFLKDNVPKTKHRMYLNAHTRYRDHLEISEGNLEFEMFTTIGLIPKGRMSSALQFLRWQPRRYLSPEQQNWALKRPEAVQHNAYKLFELKRAAGIIPSRELVLHILEECSARHTKELKADTNLKLELVNKGFRSLLKKLTSLSRQDKSLLKVIDLLEQAWEELSQSRLFRK